MTVLTITIPESIRQTRVIIHKTEGKKLRIALDNNARIWRRHRLQNSLQYICANVFQLLRFFFCILLTLCTGMYESCYSQFYAKIRASFSSCRCDCTKVVQRQLTLLQIRVPLFFYLSHFVSIYSMSSMTDFGNSILNHS